MHALRHQLRRFAWIALVAIFGLALAPAVSHALAGGGPGNPWAEICSATGDPASPQAPALHLEHCPLCGHASAVPALPPAPAMVLAVPDGADYLPSLFTQASATLFVWVSAQARAPPTSS